MIGVARETVSRAFSNVKKRGILRGKRSTWVICNESALKAIAGDCWIELHPAGSGREYVIPGFA